MSVETLAATLAALALLGLALVGWLYLRLRGEVERLQERLEHLASRPARPPAPAEVPPAEAPVPAPSPPMPAPAPREAVRRADPPDERPYAGPTLIAVPDLAAGADPAASAGLATAELADRFGAIWEMAGAGLDAGAIAREVGQPVGQVELILGLRRQLAAAGGSGAGASAAGTGPGRGGVSPT